MSPDPLDDALHRYFALAAFRTGQREAVQTVLDGRDLVAVMPTGAGKSLCFQLPAMMLEGPTIVVSPLIALMKDQVDALRGRGIAAAAIHSLMSADERASAERALLNGELRLVYLAPERLASVGFRRTLHASRPARLIVDEAHCISQWGHDFRPDYRRIGELRADLGVPAAAFTATATPDVRADISVQLGLVDPVELVTGFERPNLTLSVEPCRGRNEKIAALEALIRDAGLPGIVYASTRKSVDGWAELLELKGLRVGRYHAGLPDEQRTRAQDDFLAGRVDVICATNAFGMGVDKSNIRFVAHADLPGSVEAYYQEAGRAGRDGGAARCSLLFAPTDARTQEFFLGGSNPGPGTFGRVWEALGAGADELSIEEDAGADAVERMAAVTASRLLRRAAEVAGRRLGEGAPPVDLPARAVKARRDRDRLDTMLRYGFGRECRTRFIYDYFAGSTQSDRAPRCGTCDVCLGWRRGIERELNDAEYEQVRIVLSGVGRISGRFGAERIAKMLLGLRDNGPTGAELERVPTFGRLAGAGMDRVRGLLASLADSGFIERRSMDGGRAGMFVLALTVEGRRVAMGELRPSLAVPEAGARRQRRKGGPAPVPDGVDPELLGRLKAWRTDEARRREVPPYVIFHDKTLAALAEAHPRSEEELLEVSGVGPAKLASYGTALLDMLRGSGG